MRLQFRLPCKISIQEDEIYFVLIDLRFQKLRELLLNRAAVRIWHLISQSNVLW